MNLRIEDAAREGQLQPIEKERFGISEERASDRRGMSVVRPDRKVRADGYGGGGRGQDEEDRKDRIGFRKGRGEQILYGIYPL